MGRMGSIDLKKFSKPVNRIVPIISGDGVYKRRKFNSSKPDGFYWYEFGNEISLLTNAVDRIQTDRMMDKLPPFRGIAYGNSIIPLNFSVANFLGYNETIPIHFMNADLGMIIVARRWENGNLLFHKVDAGAKHQLLTLGVKHKVEKGEELGPHKGLTPEMRFFYLLMILDKQRIEEWEQLDKLELGRLEREKRKKQFEKSFAGRLQKAINDAGGKLINFNKRGDKVDLEWMVGKESFHSSLDQNFRMLDLGFCAEGHDKDHSVSSAIQLAKQFIDEGLIYRTRE